MPTKFGTRTCCPCAHGRRLFQPVLMASRSSIYFSVPSEKRPKRQCHLDTSWTKEFRDIERSSNGEMVAYCVLCNSDFSVSHGGRNDITVHVNGKRHKGMAQSSSSSKPVTSFFSQPALQEMISVEARWSLFVAKHNLAF